MRRSIWPRHTYTPVSSQVLDTVSTADDVAGLHGVQVERFQRLVDDMWSTMHGRCRTGQHEEPPRRDDANAERQLAGINEMDHHAVALLSSRLIAASHYYGPHPHHGSRVHRVCGRYRLTAC